MIRYTGRIYPMWARFSEGDRVYKLYVSPSTDAEEDKYFYQVFIIRDGKRLTEYEAIFGKKEKKNWRKK